MNFADLVRFLINIFDKSQQKKIIHYFKKEFTKPIVIFDVGSHHGESISFFKKNFIIQEIHCFEPSHKNFNVLKKKFLSSDVFINNYGLSNKIGNYEMNQLEESSSSTLCDINFNSKYYKRKSLIVSPITKKIHQEKITVNLQTLDSYANKKNIKEIDILKIDTEGHELEVLRGAEKTLSFIKYIYFEHHYDNMLKKNYKFSDINVFLNKYGFKKVFKIKMIFRKSFEYIYSR